MDSSFRVIIVGAGPTGLATANMLAAAQIDFVILEQHKQVVTDSGACIMLWPHSARVLDQLGLLESARSRSLGLHSKGTVDSTGRRISNDPTFIWIEEKYAVSHVYTAHPRLTR